MSRCSNRFRSPLVVPLLLLILTSVPALARKAVDRVVVVVNDEVVLESDINKFSDKLKSKSFQELFGGIDRNLLKSRESIIQLLVEEKIINQQVKKLELTASPEEIDGQVRAIINRNGITQAQLRERLKQLGTNMAEYRDGIKRQIERRNLIDREIKPNLKISDEQLRHYYQKMNEGSTQSEYEIAHILIGKKANAKSRADIVWKELSQGKITFEEAAKNYSDDASTAGNGGNLGLFSSGSLAKEFKKVVPKTKVGEFTKPVQTSLGYHIIKVVSVKQADFSSLPEAKKEELRNAMFAEELESRMVLWIERKKKEAHIDLVRR